jgi:hypothetical protein
MEIDPHSVPKRCAKISSNPIKFNVHAALTAITISAHWPALNSLIYAGAGRGIFSEPISTGNAISKMQSFA